MLNSNYIKENVVALLPIDSTMYDRQLEILISGAMSKLLNEGIDNVFTEEENDALNYIICITYQVAMDLGLDLDLDKMQKQYITRVNTLRTGLLNARS